MRISVVMPAYNEAETIEQSIRYCFSVLKKFEDQSEIVVTNDGSRDDTGKILKKLQTEFDDLVVLENNPNQGYGAAMTRAMQASKGELIVTIDSDGQFDLADAEPMLDAWQEETDIITGYRKAKQDSFLKVIADRIMNRLIRIMFGVSYKDTNCALKLLNGDVFRTLPLEARGFQLPTEILLKAHALKMNIIELPVNHTHREGGASSLAPFKTGWHMLVFLIYLRQKIRLYRKGVLRRL